MHGTGMAVLAAALLLPTPLAFQEQERPRLSLEREQSPDPISNSGCRLTRDQGTVIEVLESGTCEYSAGVTMKGDVDVTLQARVLSGPDNFGYGVIFGRQEVSGRHSSYQFVVSGNGYYRLRFWDGARHITLVDWTRHSAIKTGYDVENTLRVVTDGTLIRCFVNDRYVGGHVANGTLVGGLGFVVEQLGMRARFGSMAMSSMDTVIREGPTPGRVLFSDDLITNTKFQVGGGIVCKAGYDAEGYVVENVAARGLCDLPLPAAGAFGSNMTVNVRVRLRQGPKDQSFGLYVGREGATSIPLIIGVIDGQGTFQITQRTTGWQRLTRLLVHDSIHKGNLWNRIVLEVRGQTIRGYVNGALTGQAHVEAPIRGQIGFYVNSPGMLAVFRDLSIVEN